MATENFMGLGGDAMPEVAEEVAEKPVVTETAPVVTEEVKPTVVTEEQPEKPADEQVTEPQVKEVIKEVEKIVEKYPEMDEYTKDIFDALIEGKEDVLLNFLSEKHKDFKTMSDYDVVKENLKRSNPKWSGDDVELEIQTKYGELTKINLASINAEDDPDGYDAAVKHNKEVQANELLLKRDARDARILLDESKKDIKLPKIKAAQAEQNTPTAEDIANANQKWADDVTTEVPKLDEFTFKVGDKESGYEDVSYKVTDAEKAEQLEFMKGFNLPTLAKELGWVDKDGKADILKTAGDVLKLKKINQLLQSAYTQGKTAGTKGIKTDIKNIDLNQNTGGTVHVTNGDFNPFAHLVPK